MIRYGSKVLSSVYDYFCQGRLRHGCSTIYFYDVYFWFLSNTVIYPLTLLRFVSLRVLFVVLYSLWIYEGDASQQVRKNPLLLGMDS